MSRDTDTNFKSYAGETGLHISGEVLRPSAPDSFDDVFKLSRVTDSTFLDGTVYAGDAKENAMDANNHCERVNVLNYRLHGGRQCSIVVKGACKDIYIDATLDPHPLAKYDVQWDGYSDQGKEASTGTLSLSRADGKPVRLAFGRWRRPSAQKPYKTLWLHSIGLHVYNLWRDLVG